MSLIPEIIIQRILVNGIRKVRNVPWKSSQLFRNVPQSFSDQFSSLIENTPIDVTINYPREDSQFPCIAILLRAEEESNIVLGDLLSAGYDHTDTLFGSEGLFFSSGESEPATAQGLGGITATGTPVSDPPRLFDKSKPVYKERRGSGFSCSYLLQIMTDNQDFTIFLYHLIRYIILADMSTLIANGMYELRLSGTDFLPQASQSPNFVFMRGINMNFLYFADHYKVAGDDDLESIAKAFVINIASGHAGTGDHLAEVQEPLIQSIVPSTGAVGSTVSVVIIGINFEYGLSVDFVLSNPPAHLGAPSGLLGSENGVIVSSLFLGDSETVIEASFGLPAGGDSTVGVFHPAGTDVVPNSVTAGMFLEVIGPNTHPAHLEKRRITASGSSSIIVANDFSSSLSGAIVQVIKRSTITNVKKVGGHPIEKQFTFDVTIGADVVLGDWDLKITNPDLMSSTLTNSFTIT